MKSTSLVLSLALLLAGFPAVADFESASEAYQNRDYRTAYQEFMQLAQAGDPRAQTVIALMHKYGESVPPDASEALAWYLRAAEAGYAPAQYYVGEMYAEGLGTEPDRETAIAWLQKAAEAGFQRASSRLSAMGANTGQDTDEAEKVRTTASDPWNFRLPNDIRYDGNAVSAPSTETVSVQVGTMGTLAGANRLWEWLTVQAPELFEDREPVVGLSDDSESRVYRVSTGPFENLEEATRFCKRLNLRIRPAQCIPHQPQGSQPGPPG